MKKYTIKQRSIEAIQWTGDNYDLIKQSLGNKITYSFRISMREKFTDISTLLLENSVCFEKIKITDWIILDANDNGKVYTLSDRYFKETYELTG
jgi:hypothetical protein